MAGTTVSLTDDRAWIPVDAPIKGDPKTRNATTYLRVVSQFKVESNPRHRWRNNNTYCNIFVWDVTRAMGAEIPHWVDANGAPVGVGKGRELNGNGTADWLIRISSRYGWKEVGAEQAQQFANQGHPTVAAWLNPGGIGHVAMVVPGTYSATLGPAAAQAGARNFTQGTIAEGFGKQRLGLVRYWTHTGGSGGGKLVAAAALVVAALFAFI